MPYRHPVAPLLALFALFALAALPSCAALPPASPLLAEDCPAPGQWQQDGQTVDVVTLMAELAGRRVVLLGEQHRRHDHHRWQLHTLAGLHAHQPDMAIGLEMLPREAQPALDAWSAGELDEARFLEASGWQDAWGLDPKLYLPILHFARLQRIPLLALNVTPELRRRIAAEGWEAIPAAERHGITPPAAAPVAYRDTLAEVYARHPDQPEDGLEPFIDAQLVWDRAMAQALAEATADAALVVGLIGQGHLSYSHGVPHQLDDLGVTDHRVLLPWSPDDGCPPPAGIADALFLLDGDDAS